MVGDVAGTQKYTAQQVCEALKRTKGMIYIAAEQLGCSAQTIKNYAVRYASVREIMEQEDEQVNDIAELKLIQAIQAGESWAVKYRLSTKGRHRGYVERQENVLSTDKDNPLTIEVRHVDYRDDLAQITE